MATIRRVEEALLRLFSEGLLHGTVHTCIGQEAGAVGIVSALDVDRDLIVSNHRGHGHFLAYCDDVDGLIGEIMGRRSGVCGGIGGSQHLHKGGFYSNGILGGTSPVATGMAYAEKALGSGRVVVAFHGDGALAEGVVYEALNMAALWQLPIVFAVELNGYAQSTPTHLEHSGSLESRGRSFDIPSTVVDGTLVEEVHAAGLEAVARARDGGGPSMIFMTCCRFAPHSKGDDNREPEEIARARARDPIAILRERLDATWCDTVDRDIDDRIESAVARARAAPVLSREELLAAVSR